MDRSLFWKTKLYSNSLPRSNEYKTFIIVTSNLNWGVSTRAVCDPLYYAFINRMDGNNTTNRMKTRKRKKLQQEKQPNKMI